MRCVKQLCDLSKSLCKIIYHFLYLNSMVVQGFEIESEFYCFYFMIKICFVCPGDSSNEEEAIISTAFPVYWACEITTVCYKRSFGTQLEVVLKYMVKKIITKVQRELGREIDSCYFLIISYFSMNNINN